MFYPSAIEEAKAHEAFGEKAWLTPYLLGPPEGHAQMRPVLEGMGTINLGGSEWGAVYAKVPIKLDQNEIEIAISKIRECAEKSGIDATLIDIDATPDVETSKFFTVWQGD